MPQPKKPLPDGEFRIICDVWARNRLDPAAEDSGWSLDRWQYERASLFLRAWGNAWAQADAVRSFEAMKRRGESGNAAIV